MAHIRNEPSYRYNRQSSARARVQAPAREGREPSDEEAALIDRCLAAIREAGGEADAAAMRRQVAVLRKWLAKGYDPKGEIVATICAVARRAGRARIKSLEYFTAEIAAAAALRKSGSCQEKEEEHEATRHRAERRRAADAGASPYSAFERGSARVLARLGGEKADGGGAGAGGSRRAGEGGGGPAGGDEARAGGGDP
jgi:hypothetical protein